MSDFLARHRLILCAYAAALVLLGITALFSPGFLTPANARSTLVLATFVGIVALGQTFVIHYWWWHRPVHTLGAQ